MRYSYGAALICGAFIACGGSNDEGMKSPPKSVTLMGDTACERYASLATALGCDAPNDCMIEDACDDIAVEWIDCAATDTSQCHCESDGDLNCEGSFKANEGVALCTVEYQAYKDCSEP
jgi:hypothetical protein